jgi:chromosome segregation ATPase
MYKVLYCDYKKVCEEKKKLQKDVLALMNGQGWDKETASLNLKLLRCEREINSLKVNLAQKEERIEDLKLQKSHLKRQLKELTNNEGQTQ